MTGRWRAALPVSNAVNRCSWPGFLVQIGHTDGEVYETPGCVPALSSVVGALVLLIAAVGRKKLAEPSRAHSRRRFDTDRRTINSEQFWAAPSGDTGTGR